MAKENKVDTGAAAKRKARRDDRLVVIPPCEDPERRELLESDDVEWLMYYFGEGNGCDAPFTYAFTEQQLEMIAAIGRAVAVGGDQAEAMSRGEGKTTICERLVIKYVLQGRVKFPVIFAATATAANDDLEEIKTALETNEFLRADYPEVCVPIDALEGVPQRAGTMLVSGHRHDDSKPFEEEQANFSWCGQQVYLPNVPGSPSASSVIATRGLEAAVRGLKKKGKRPDLAVIDDPDTEDTASSAEQSRKLERRIDRAIGALGGQKRRIARVMLTTLQSGTSVSFKFTDPKQKPSWKGKRKRFLLKPPDEIELWQTFVILKQEDYLADTTTAHDFYLQNRKKMDAGSQVANCNRFTEEESSALEFYYCEVARLGPEAVATEYDNDPPEESGPVESGITPTRIQKQTSGYDRCVIPPGCTVLVQGIDCKKNSLHWVVRAWRPDCVGYVIDYGVHVVQGVQYKKEDGVDVALNRALLERMEAFEAEEYKFPDGGTIPKKQIITLVDCRYQTDAIRAACREIGPGCLPVMAFGKSRGCMGVSFRRCKKTSKSTPGDRYNLIKDNGQLIVQIDADHWKSWEHSRWMTGPDRPGRLFMWGDEDEKSRRYGGLSRDQQKHHSYARHLTNEIETEIPVKGGGTIRAFKAKAQNVHWFDASYYSDVGARIRGISLVILGLRSAAKPRKKKATQKVFYG